MTPLRFKSEWVDRYQRDRSFYASAFNPFENWEQLRFFEMGANQHLFNGLSILYAGTEDHLANRFLSASVDTVDRAIAENKFECSEIERSRFPRNLGVARRARAYALFLRDDALPEGELLEASVAFENSCRKLGRRAGDSHDQAAYLGAVRLALVAGDVARHRSLLGGRRTFKWHPEEHLLNQRISIATADGSLPHDDDLKSAFRAFLDKVRNPEFSTEVFFETDIARFELACLWCRYFDPGGLSRRGAIEVASE